MAQSSKFHENCGCFLICTPHKTRTFTVRLAVTTKYQGNGFAAEVLLGRDHPRVVPIGPIVRGVIAFPILGTWWDATTKVASQSVHLQASYGISNTFQQRPSAILNFKNFNIWSHDCHCGPNLLLHTEFHQHWFTISASRRPWLHNVQCAVARQRPSPWQPHHSGHVGHMMGCDHPSCVPVGPLVGELCHLEYFPTWRPSAILNFKNFNI